MKQKPAETNYRSIAKAISYRTLSVMADFTVAYFFTRNTTFSAGIVLFVNLYSTFLYYFHERLWAHIRWGRSQNHLPLVEKSETVTSQGHSEGASLGTV